MSLFCHFGRLISSLSRDCPRISSIPSNRITLAIARVQPATGQFLANSTIAAMWHDCIRYERCVRVCRMESRAPTSEWCSLTTWRYEILTVLFNGRSGFRLTNYYTYTLLHTFFCVFHTYFIIPSAHVSSLVTTNEGNTRQT